MTRTDILEQIFKEQPNVLKHIAELRAELEKDNPTIQVDGQIVMEGAPARKVLEPMLECLVTCAELYESAKKQFSN